MIFFFKKVCQIKSIVAVQRTYTLYLTLSHTMVFKRCVESINSSDHAPFIYS